ncbi:hypothetical protein MST22_15535 [Virgibacillus halodenitrificans]|uniref:hypothetical protein n=1 Tax=Virgibacillus halodenitrificans TaxID=1482 RepID=UPI001FB549A6|nr:hypothetical protein [Virgibacillus halodenitrificans]MCJ0932559.1 hypothetical protein [Virgibacillus halodenitrificans]
MVNDMERDDSLMAFTHAMRYLFSGVDLSTQRDQTVKVAHTAEGNKIHTIVFDENYPQRVSK